jgi:hypothetical protein
VETEVEAAAKEVEAVEAVDEAAKAVEAVEAVEAAAKAASWLKGLLSQSCNAPEPPPAAYSL